MDKATNGQSLTNTKKKERGAIVTAPRSSLVCCNQFPI
jgi:hypothetical protein